MFTFIISSIVVLSAFIYFYKEYTNYGSINDINILSKDDNSTNINETTSIILKNNEENNNIENNIKEIIEEIIVNIESNEDNNEEIIEDIENDEDFKNIKIIVSHSKNTVLDNDIDNNIDNEYIII